MKKLKVEYIFTDDISPFSQNAKVHSDHQIDQIKKSIQAFGYTNPILLDRTNTIIAGHGRFLAMCKLGYKTIPCIYIDHLNKEQIHAYRLADNKIAENAQWDESLLRIELEFLQDFDVNYDFSALGFETAEIDSIFSSSAATANELDEVIPDIQKRTVSKNGDVFQCGLHRIGCGDSRNSGFLREVANQQSVSLVCVDVPYNVSIEGHARGLGRHQHQNFMMASGEMSAAEYIQFLTVCLLNFKRVCCDGALHYIFCDWRHLYELFQATQDLYSKFINLCVWNKSNGGMGSFYRSKHELICIFKQSTAPHINNIDLGKHGRYRSNVWDYPGLSSFSKDRDKELALHGTPKPVALIKDIILDASHRDDVVLDGFLGAGSMLMACEQVHRRCIGIEIDPKYVDVTLQRWLEYTGIEPIHVETGLTFTELADQRFRDQEVNHG